MSSNGYTQQYYERLKCSASSSAYVVVPLVIDLLNPRSVVDVGCGTAEWAAAFKSCGIATILGIDGDYVDRGELAIAADQFLAADLTQPLSIDQKFDLAISLEVAEHLPPECARQFVATLTGLAPAVLFSASIPHQGGEHHVNEQWPQYWSEYFTDQGFVAFDVIRPLIWSHPMVQWWYAQNALLYIDRDHLANLPKLQTMKSVSPTLALVHPKCLEQLAWKCWVREAILELIQVTRANSRILLVDESQLGDFPETGRQLCAFSEDDGVDSGPPEDSRAAFRQLDRQLERGAQYIAFAWPSFWWLDHYAEFAKHLRNQGCEVLHTENWVVFALSGA
jgi:SAM-dependent methyltransferase